MTSVIQYHLYKSAPTRTLFLVDSQARYYTEGNNILRVLNVLSLPGAKITHAYDLLPPPNIIETIILFIGGDNAFNGFELSQEPASAVSKEIFDLENVVSTLAKDVFVLGIPVRNENKERALKVNQPLEATAPRVPQVKKSRKKKTEEMTSEFTNMMYCSVSNFVNGMRYFRSEQARSQQHQQSHQKLNSLPKVQTSTSRSWRHCRI